MSTSKHTQLIELYKSNLKINNLDFSDIQNTGVVGFSENIDDGGLSEVSSGFVNAGDFLELPDIFVGLSSFNLQSDSASDTLLGTGAQKVFVSYFDNSRNRTFQIIDMSTNPITVNVVDPLTCVRMGDAQVIQTGSNLANVGRITLTNPIGGGVYEQIGIGNNFSASVHTFIPKGNRFHISFLNGNLYSTANDDIAIFYQVKASDASHWHTLVKFFQKGSSTSNFSFPLNGLDMRPQNFYPLTVANSLDIRVCAEKLSNGGICAVSLSIPGYYQLLPP